MGTPVGSGKGEAKCTDCPCGERLEKEDGPGRSREDRVGRAASGSQQESQPGPGGVLSMGGFRVRGTDAVPGWGSRRGASQISGALGGSTPAPPALVSLGPGPGGKGPRAPGCLVRARIEWAVPPRLTHGFHWSYGMAQGWGGGVQTPVCGHVWGAGLAFLAITPALGLRGGGRVSRVRVRRTERWQGWSRVPQGGAEPACSIQENHFWVWLRAKGIPTALKATCFHHGPTPPRPFLPEKDFEGFLRKSN